MDCRYRRLVTVPPIYTTEITFLDLSHNKLGPMSDYEPLTNLASLKTLHIHRNNLGNMSEYTAFTNLTSLEILNMHDDYITSINDDTLKGLTSLRILNMSNNNIEILSGRPFKYLSKLVKLYLSHTDESQSSLSYCSLEYGLRHLTPSAFSGLISLEWLDLHCNLLSTLPKNIFAVLHNLKYLDLSLNQFVQFPSHTVAPLNALQTLNIAYNQYTNVSFGPAFQNLTNLEELNIRQNDGLYTTGDDAYQYFTDVPLRTLHMVIMPTNATQVYHPLTQVRHLVCQVNCWQNNMTLSEVASMLTTMEHSPLQNLSLNFINGPTLDDNSLKPLSVFNKSLQVLEIHDSRTSPHPLTAIKDNSFVWFSNLQELTVSGHPYLSHLADGSFNGLQKLQQLDLSGNYLITLNYQAFEIFIQSRSLLYVDLSYNNLAYMSLDWSLPVTHLSLAGNPLKWIMWLDYNKVAKSNLTVLNVENLKDDYNELTIDLFSSDTWSIFPLESLLQLKAGLYHNTDEYKIKSYIYVYNLCQVAPNIEYIDLHGRFLYHATTLVDTLSSECSQVTYFDMSGSNLFYSKVSKQLTQPAIHFPHLNTLVLSSNMISQVSEIAFIQAPSLTSLDLSHNIIETIDAKIAASLLQNVMYLNLEDNQIISVHWMSYLSNIHILNIAQNLISEIPQSFLDQTTQLSILDASANPFDCTPCTVKPFQHWLITDPNTKIKTYAAYQCLSPIHNSITSVYTDYCPYLTLIYISASALAIIIIGIITVLLKRYHWRIRYQLFLLFHKNRGKYGPDEEIEEIDLEACDQPLVPIPHRRPDAYVAFAKEDELWIGNELVENLEDGPEPFQLCIKERGDIPSSPGRFILDVICHGITHSRRTIVVISRHFMASGMCEYQLKIASLRSIEERRDVLIVVLLEDIPDKDMTMLLHQTLCRNKTVLKWPSDRVGRDLFWLRLRKELKRSVKMKCKAKLSI